MDLSFNQLASLPTSVFDGLSNLQRLILHSNRLAEFKAETVRGLTELGSLQLQNNPISSTETPTLSELRQVAGAAGEIDFGKPDDPEIVVRAEPTELEIAEGESATFELELQLGIVDPFQINAKSDNTDVALKPNRAWFGPEEWGEMPREITVSVAQDDDALDETATISYVFAMGTEPPGIETIKIEIKINDDDAAPITGICDRTQQVRDQILSQTSGISDCAEITPVHLKAITRLDLSEKGITTLQSRDFAGLTSLFELYLSGNQLASLPDSRTWRHCIYTTIS